MNLPIEAKLMAVFIAAFLLLLWLTNRNVAIPLDCVSETVSEQGEDGSLVTSTRVLCETPQREHLHAFGASNRYAQSKPKLMRDREIMQFNRVEDRQVLPTPFGRYNTKYPLYGMGRVSWELDTPSTELDYLGSGYQ